jgi:penicillin amidase
MGGVTLPTLLRIISDEEYRSGFGKAAADCAAPCRDALLGRALDAAVAQVSEMRGADVTKWRWGSLHTAHFIHALGNSAERAAIFNLGPVERAGDGTTPNAGPGPNYTQNHGASFRQIIDLANFDRSVAANTPGQSGQPGSRHYDDLLKLWAKDEYFPLLFSRPAVEKNASARLTLRPKTVKQEARR